MPFYKNDEPTLTMTPDEIIAEYKQAKVPMKQIAILADENLCSKKEIVQILLDAGCPVPGQYLPKSKKDEVVKTAQAEKAKADKVADKTDTTEDKRPKGYAVPPGVTLRLAALDLIEKRLPDEEAPLAIAWNFVNEIRGILQLIKEVEGRG